MVTHDAECYYWDQVPLNQHKTQTHIEYLHFPSGASTPTTLSIAKYGKWHINEEKNCAPENHAAMLETGKCAFTSLVFPTLIMELLLCNIHRVKYWQWVSRKNYSLDLMTPLRNCKCQMQQPYVQQHQGAQGWNICKTGICGVKGKVGQEQ